MERTECFVPAVMLSQTAHRVGDQPSHVTQILQVQAESLRFSGLLGSHCILKPRALGPPNGLLGDPILHRSELPSPQGFPGHSVHGGRFLPKTASLER